jgi:subtilase family serine protease
MKKTREACTKPKLWTAVILAGLIATVLALPAGAAPAPASRGRKPNCAPAALRHFRCFSQIVTDANGKPIITAAPSGYGPTQFHRGYNLPTATKKANTIAIVDAFWIPTVKSDLDTFNATYGLPSFPTCASPTATSCLQIYRQDGSLVSDTNHPAEDDGWGLEIDLDVQAVHEICQNCRIDLVLADDNYFSNLEAAVNQAASLGAREISNSYGAFGYDCTEPGYDHPNTAVVVSSGDSGFGIACPAVENTVVSVGGTTLNLNGDNSYNSESVWGGTGSGCSSVQAARAWQTSLANWTSTGCGTNRAMNDVAADADPFTGAAVYDCSYYGSCGWLQVGGTSLSAPLIAAVYALAGNADRVAYPASLPYRKLGKSSLHDVTSGSNGSCSPAIQCTAGPGYDLPTGVGTPRDVGAF